MKSTCFHEILFHESKFCNFLHSILLFTSHPNDSKMCILSEDLWIFQYSVLKLGQHMDQLMDTVLPESCKSFISEIAMILCETCRSQQSEVLVDTVVPTSSPSLLRRIYRNIPSL